MGRHRKISESGEAASGPRIVGGELRGRTLEFLPGERTRPMKDRVRETLFDLVGPRVKGAVAIDLFAGTGALGFEALSRGATRAVFAERHFPTADAVRRSARLLGVEERCAVCAGDVLLWAKKMPPLPTSAPWLVFVSPPWAFFTERAGDLMQLVTAMRTTAPEKSIFVVESDDSFDAAALPGTGWQSRAIAPAVLHLVF
jgi:16S rRNA (guanine966-N2)-methyltransferase